MKTLISPHENIFKRLNLTSNEYQSILLISDNECEDLMSIVSDNLKGIKNVQFLDDFQTIDYKLSDWQILGSTDLKEYDLIILSVEKTKQWRILREIRKTGSEETNVLCLSEENQVDDELSFPGFYISMQIRVNHLTAFFLSSRKKSLELLKFKWVEKLTELDKCRIIELMNRIIEKEPGIGYPKPLSLEEGKKVMDDLDNALLNKEKYLLLIETSDRLIGHTILKPFSSPNNKHIGEIMRAFLSRNFRGLGVEMMSMYYILEKSKSIGLESLILDVRAGTTAEKKWESIGFKRYGLLPKYSCVNGQYFDGSYMMQTIKELEEKINK